MMQGITFGPAFPLSLPMTLEENINVCADVKLVFHPHFFFAAGTQNYKTIRYLERSQRSYKYGNEA